MNCATHPETPATAYCRSCGRPLCDSCKRLSAGTVFCEEHAPTPAATAQGGPYSQPVYTAPAVADASASPGLALFLGFIPGVGAIYNGQYAKGLIHAIIFGMLVSIVGSNYVGALEPLFGILIAVWVFYMVLEAYHTARKRRAGEPIDEFSSLVDLRGNSTRFPAGAVLLILLGGVLLLSTTEVISMERLMRYWPVLLIVAGAYMLYTRMAASRAADRTEASHGEQ
jgi:TM2 domain-containing membrane protein YozV